MRVAIHTLGCKVNQYESQAMEEILTARGHTLVPFEDPADIYIVNSCTGWAFWTSWNKWPGANRRPNRWKT